MRTLMGVVVLVLLGGCGDDAGGDHDLTVPADLSMGDLTPVVVSIVVSPATPKIVVGDTQAFTAMASYSDATTRDVTALAAWSSADLTVATVDSPGQISGVARGSSAIEATLGGVSSVPVPLQVRAVDSIAISWSGSGMPTTTTGTDLQLSATATLSDTATLDVTMRATWATSAMNVIATITNGLAHTGNDKGTSDITASFGGKVGMTTVLVQ